MKARWSPFGRSAEAPRARGAVRGAWRECWREFARRARLLLLARLPALAARRLELDDRELGVLGEELAARHLAAEGWRVLGRRVRTAAAEVDLWAEECHVLVVVEVKTARAPALPVPRAHPGAARAGLLLRRPGRRLARAQLARLARAGRILARARARDGAGSRVRIDLVEVTLGRRGAGFTIVHHRGLRRPLA